MKKGVDPVLVFWKAFGIFKEGGTTEAIRELEMIQSRREIQFAATMALIFYHKHCRVVDNETVDQLTFSSDEIESQASDKDLINAATFFLHVNELKKASQTVQKVIESNSSNLNAIALKGWIYLNAPKEDYVNKSVQIFDSVLNEEDGGNRNHIEALMGRTKYYQMNKKYGVSVEILTELSITYKDFVPALLDKSKLHIIQAEWDMAIETIQKVLYDDPRNIEAIKIYIFYLLSRENDPEQLDEKF